MPAITGPAIAAPTPDDILPLTPGRARRPLRARRLVPPARSQRPAGRLLRLAAAMADTRPCTDPGVDLFPLAYLRFVAFDLAHEPSPDRARLADDRPVEPSPPVPELRSIYGDGHPSAIDDGRPGSSRPRCGDGARPPGFGDPVLDGVGEAIVVWHQRFSARAPGSPAERHERARSATVALHQRILLHDVLPAVCDPVAVEAAVARCEAPTATALEQRRISVEAMAAGLPALASCLPADHPGDGLPIVAGAGRSSSPPTRSLDTLMFESPGQAAGSPAHPSLPHHILTVGERVGLPSGQDLVARVGPGPRIIELSQRDIERTLLGPALAELDMLASTPLWVYLLAEAELVCGGRRLGPLGSWLVAEALVPLVAHDPAVRAAGPVASLAATALAPLGRRY